MKYSITSTIGAAALAIVAVLAVPGSPQASELWASYWKLLDGNDYFASGEHLVFDAARLSADGTTIIAVGYSSVTGGRTMLFFDATTGDETEVTLPAGVSSTYRGAVAISADGTRAFFADSGNDSLYRVDRNAPGTPTVTKILDQDDYQGANPNNINGIYQVRTLAAGDAVLFNEDRDDLWRVDALTGAASLVVDDELVPRDGGIGWAVSWFDVSDDESVIAFTLTGYNDGATHQKPELFVMSGGSYSQLTNESLPVFPYHVPKSYVEINGQGTIITYDDSGVGQWTSIHTDGSDKHQLHPASSNVAGSSMSGDGQLLLFNDMYAAGGHLARTDGSGGTDIMPIYPIGLWATLHPEISADGSRMSFVSGGNFRKLYAGALRPASWVGPGPTIDPITLDPLWLPATDPGSGVMLTVAISDPHGPTHVVGTCIGHYIDGKLKGYWEDLPVLFNTAPHDDGANPDQSAGDYLYSTFGVIAGGYPNVPRLNLRVGAQDVDGNVTLREVVLRIYEFQDGFESGDLSAWSASAP